MKGTQHFSRMNYNVRRGLREIVAEDHRIPQDDWLVVLSEFDNACAYCYAEASAENRGIVPDHLVAVTDFGELVAGNVVPACQTCNDSRGNKPWRTFLANRFPLEAEMRTHRIEQFIATHNYLPSSPELALFPDELEQYQALIADWESLLKKAQQLRSKVSKRRSEAKEAFIRTS
ncbi:MAG TPA: HNH endonuclease signature motif containing protein [Methylotenera sp.]|nr:HNH endonuclease signature motif containing protein [Methylotenera sp.]